MHRPSPLAHFVVAMASLAWLGSAAFGEEAKGAVKEPKLTGAEAQAAAEARDAVQTAVAKAAAAAANVEAQAAAEPAQLKALPMVFLPGFSSVPLPNPLANWDTRQGFLGVTLDADEEELADEAPAKKDAPKKIRGVGVSGVIDDSPAAKAGLKGGDRVLKLEGKAATSMVQLRTMIRALKPEQEVKLLVRRDEKEIEIKAKLGASPAQVAGGAALQLMIGGVPLNNVEDQRQAIPGVVVFNRQANMFRQFPGSSFPTQNADKDKEKDSVTLRDGNRFAGKIRGIDPVKGLILQRDGQPDLELIEEHIAALNFAERKNADSTAKAAPASLPKVVLQLRDGSMVFGDALTMENGAVRLALAAGDAHHARQNLEFRKEHVQSLTLSDGDSPQIYEGPTALTGWTTGRYGTAQWEYKDGALFAEGSGPIGRNLGRMPDPIDVSFEINFPPHMQHFGIQLFSAGVNESGVGTLSLNFSPNQIYGNHNDGSRTNQYNKPIEEVARIISGKSEKVRYRVLVDRVNGKALIFVNGKPVADWKLSKVKREDLGKCGGTFSITPHATISDTKFELRNVRILPWDGKVPDKDEAPIAAKGDQVLTSAAVSKNGTIARITDGEVFLDAGEKVAREKTLYVRFAEPGKAELNVPFTGTARLQNGSEIRAAKVTGTGETITITTSSGPQITLPFSAMRALEFLPRAGQAPVALKTLDLLTLSDGTQLAGRAILPITETKIGWQIAASKVPLQFDLGKVAGVFFRAPAGETKPAVIDGASVMRLGNGDWLPGNVVSLDSKQLVMKTDLAPQFTVPLSGLRALYLSTDAASTVIDGATGRDLWHENADPNRPNNSRRPAEDSTMAERSWKYFDGGYIVQGVPRNGQQTISQRWPEFPGSYAVNFQSATPGRASYFNAQISNSKNERTFSVQASGTRLYVYFNPPYSRARRAAVGGQKQIEIATNESGKTDVSLVFDRPGKAFRIIIGGKEVGKMTFKEGEAEEALDACGVTLTTSYYSSPNAGRSRIEHIWLAPWSAAAEKVSLTGKTAGKSPENDAAKEANAEKATPTEPVMFLANGDDFTGAIEKITPELVTVNSDAGPLEFPAKRVAWIHFPQCAEPIAEHYPRLRFRERGLLSVNDLHIGNDRVQCKTLSGMPLEFPLNLVREIVWRPLSEK